MVAMYPAREWKIDVLISGIRETRGALGWREGFYVCGKWGPGVSEAFLNVRI